MTGVTGLFPVLSPTGPSGLTPPSWPRRRPFQRQRPQTEGQPQGSREPTDQGLGPHRSPTGQGGETAQQTHSRRGRALGLWGVLTPSQQDLCRDLEGGSRAEDKPPPPPPGRSVTARTPFRVPLQMAQRPAFTRPVGLFSCLGTSFPRRRQCLPPPTAAAAEPAVSTHGASLSQSRARAQGGTLHPQQELC